MAHPKTQKAALTALKNISDKQAKVSGRLINDMAELKNLQKETKTLIKKVKGVAAVQLDPDCW